MDIIRPFQYENRFNLQLDQVKVEDIPVDATIRSIGLKEYLKVAPHGHLDLYKHIVTNHDGIMKLSSEHASFLRSGVTFTQNQPSKAFDNIIYVMQNERAVLHQVFSAAFLEGARNNFNNVSFSLNFLNFIEDKKEKEKAINELSLSLEIFRSLYQQPIKTIHLAVPDEDLLIEVGRKIKPLLSS